MAYVLVGGSSAVNLYGNYLVPATLFGIVFFGLGWLMGCLI